MTNYLIIFFLLILILIIIYFSFFYNFGKKLDSKAYAKFNKINKEIYNNKNISLNEKILNFDKLYHNILKSVQYTGTFGEILKKNPIIINDINKIWRLHKLRNKISHDFGKIEDKILKNSVKEYNEEINLLLKKLK